MPDDTRSDAEVQIANTEMFEAWRRLLPDSRMRRAVGQIWTPLGIITPLYCVNCGRSCGGVYGEPLTMAVLCDPCREHWGGLPGMEETPFTPDTPPEE